MKRIGIMILVLALLGGAWWYLKKSDTAAATGATYDASASKFAVEDVSTIHQIFIVDKAGNRNVLKRQGDEWIADDQYPVDPISIEFLMKAIGRMDMQYIPPKAATQNILKNMAVHGITVELSDKNGVIIKKYIVGGMTQDERGTYFLMANSRQPYVMGVPGFAGNIRERFKPDLDRWRSQKFLRFDPKSVRRIQANYPTQPENSFDISIGDDQFDGQRISSYLIALNNIACEAYLSENPLKDSVFISQPFCEIIMERKKEDPIKLAFWTKEKANQAAQIGARYYVRKDDEFLLAQFQVIKPAFRNKSYFLNK